MLALRLGREGLPFEAVVGQLPREFLISQGLSSVILPAVAVAALYVVYRLIRRQPWRPKIQRLSGPENSVKWKKFLTEYFADGWKFLLVAVMVTMAVLAPAFIHELERGPRLVFLSAVIPLTFLNTIAVLQLRALLVQKHYRRPYDTHSWNNERIAALMAALYAALIVPGAIAFGGDTAFA